MLEDIERIRVFIGEHSREFLAADEKASFAVCCAFVRLGEAVGNIPEEVKSLNPQVDWASVRKFRNFMVHVYQAVDPARLHDTAVTDLAPLAEGPRSMLKR